MWCAGQPVFPVGDPNADPSVIPSLAKGMPHGAWIDVDKAFATGRGVAPALTCQFQLDEGKGSRRDFHACLPHCYGGHHCMLRFTRSMVSPAFCNPHGVFFSAWDATVEMARVYSPFWPACWVECPDRSRRSRSLAVKNIWSKSSALCLGRSGSNSSPLVKPPMWTHRGVYGVGKLRRALLVPIPLQVALPFQVLAVLWIGANSPNAQSDWEAGVETVSTAWIMPMGLMLPILASSSIRPLHLCFASDVGLCWSVMSSKALRLMGLRTPVCLLRGTDGMLSLRWAPPALSPRLNLGPIGSLPTSMGFINGPWTP